jgi:hypothetical protein
LIISYTIPTQNQVSPAAAVPVCGGNMLLILNKYFVTLSKVFHYIKQKDMDMFECLEKLPKEVLAILEKYSHLMYNDYNDCESMVKELEIIGWTCDYYLDAEPFDLRKIGEPSNYSHSSMTKIEK